MAIVGAVIYHVSSRAFPKPLNPLMGIVVAYVAAIVVCFIVLIFTEKSSWSQSFKQMNWAVVGLGVGAAIVEIGFILAYRVGWQLGLTSFVVNVSATSMLLLIGFIVLRERVSALSILGLCLCSVGLILITFGRHG